MFDAQLLGKVYVVSLVKREVFVEVGGRLGKLQLINNGAMPGVNAKVQEQAPDGRVWGHTYVT